QQYDPQHAHKLNHPFHVLHFRSLHRLSNVSSPSSSRNSNGNSTRESMGALLSENSTLIVEKLVSSRSIFKRPFIISICSATRPSCTSTFSASLTSIAFCSSSSRRCLMANAFFNRI